MSELPPGWIAARIGEFAEVRLGRQRSPDRHSGPNMRKYLRAANVTWAGLDLSDVKEMDFSEEELRTFRLQEGDILLSEASGSAREVGKAAVWQGEIPDCCFQNTLVRVRSPKALAPYLHRHLFADARLGRFADASRGIGIHHLGREAVENWTVALAPLGEQGRIVDRLDAVQMRSRAAREALAAVPSLLDTLRRSVLAAAFRGDLTAGWRAKNPDVEPASKLLERVRAERKRLWEHANAKKKYVEPAPVDESGLPDLPDGWAWARWDEVGFSQNGRSFPSQDYADTGTRLLRPGNLHVSGALTWTEANTRHMPDAWATKHPDFVVGPSEIVMNLTAQSLKDEFLGRVCLTQAGEQCLLNQRIARLTPVLLEPEYVLWVFKSPVFRRFVDGLNTGSLIQHMFTSQLANFAFPVAPAAEQRELLRVVRSSMECVGRLAGALTDLSDELDLLDQSTLSRAFRGELVEQDPNDEPATKLLARLRKKAAPNGRRSHGED